MNEIWNWTSLKSHGTIKLLNAIELMRTVGLRRSSFAFRLTQSFITNNWLVPRNLMRYIRCPVCSVHMMVCVYISGLHTFAVNNKRPHDQLNITLVQMSLLLVSLINEKTVKNGLTWDCLLTYKSSLSDYVPIENLYLTEHMVIYIQ